jgi:predicted nicotinamide N-methyase
VLDNRAIVAGTRVLDLAAGSGLVAIAARMAGAAPVVAADIDAFTEPAIALNAEANNVYIEIITAGLLDRPASAQPRYDVILVGDLFYERDTARRALAFLDRHARDRRARAGRRPGPHLPAEGPPHAAREYSVPVTRELEDLDIKRTTCGRDLAHVLSQNRPILRHGQIL